MISSEVQRTLVKSPPELWTELSDPEALAKHLGELGEIKITRIEPEKLVEWEAEGTTGTVAIKASGWGTKVTLSVTRELAAREEDSADEAQEVLDAESDPVGHSEAEAEAPLVEEPASEQPHADLQETSEPDSPDAPREIAVASGPTPAPATEAARRAAGRPAEDTGAEPDADRGSSPTEADEAATAEEMSQGSSTSTEPTLESQEQTEPRRGFFARLFGARRKKAAAPPPIEADEQLNEPAAPEPLAVWHPVAEPADETGAQAGSPTEIDAVEEHETSGSSQTAVAPEKDPAEPGPDPTPALEKATEAEGEPDGPEASAATAGEDLAAELKAAEEAATEQVEAVLKGVLDRLGAAHHRPFSRS